MADTTSAIYKIDGYRLLAASAQRALGDSNGDDITATYLKKADFTNASGKWEDAANAVASNSANWDKVKNKLDTSGFEAWSAGKDFDAYSAGSNIDITNHVVSGKDWTNTITATADAASANAVDTVEGKFGYNSNNEISGYNGSAFAGKEYTAGDGIAIDSNNEISVTGKYVTSATSSMNDKNLVLRNNTWVELQETGAFEVATGTGSDLHPDVSNPSKKVIYLVKDSTVTSGDSYKEWIYSDSNTWELIGDTQIDLTNYATTAWVDKNYVSTATTGSWDVTEYTGTNGISIANHSVELAPAYKTAVEAVSGKLDSAAFDAWSANADVTPYTSVTPTLISIDSSTNEVSGKDWTNTIEEASANAVTVVGTNFGTSGTSPNQVITGYNGTAFYVPDTSDFVTHTEYDVDRDAWDDVVANVSSNSGAWTHEFTMVNVPDLANVPDITNP